MSDIIVRAANSLLAVQGQDGAFAAGHNGPYYDQELPVRNTAHVMVLLFKAHELTGEAGYREAALKALAYITADERRPMGATFWARRNPQKDFSNGLIGQAWVIEALTVAAQKLEDSSLNALAEKVFLMHPFDEVAATWRIVNVDGSYAGVDTTFNHQLWFAAAGGLIADSDSVRKQVSRFLDNLEGNSLKLYENGLIVHALAGGGPVKKPVKRIVKDFVKGCLKKPRGERSRDPVINKAIGYHAFNTYAFALLFEGYKEHSFWRSEMFRKLLAFLATDLYRDGLEWFCPDPSGKGKSLPFNRFGYPYNPPGIEAAFTLQTFRDYCSPAPDRDMIASWLERQFRHTLQPASGLMTENTDDSATLSARLYEAVRLDDVELVVSG